MSSKVPPNIQRLLYQNDKYARADEYAKDVTIGTLNSVWHEKSYQKSGCRPPDTSQAKQEVEAGNRALKLLRKERLRQLLAREREQYEHELNAMGLAFTKFYD
eukprot:TRINITY_DN2967_c0_g1_i1.p4 TRINITY_DN2967_c0_g1~~TRINITY_DN2967_c0_g1_i1.p4  ORF type:complete len:103 (-),score=11.38 TRINITY_DN2967_c0_g1_i1:250-558(-)